MRAKNDHIVLDAAMRRNITPVQSARNSLESSPHIKFSFRLALLMFEFFEDFLGKAQSWCMHSGERERAGPASGGRPARGGDGGCATGHRRPGRPERPVSASMAAENDAGCDERLVACLNILRRMPTEDAEEVRLQDAYR